MNEKRIKEIQNALHISRLDNNSKINKNVLELYEEYVKENISLDECGKQIVQIFNKNKGAIEKHDMTYDGIHCIDDQGYLMFKNKLGITNYEELERATRNISLYGIIKSKELQGNYNLQHYKNVHKLLFGDLFLWAGKTRKWNIRKSEKVLDGATVSYPDYAFMEQIFEYVIKEFKEKDLKKMTIEEMANEIADTWNYIWQIHFFPDGNTRTTATFMINYLETKGIIIDPSVLDRKFKEFRDALVLYSTFDVNNQEKLISMIKEAIMLK